MGKSKCKKNGERKKKQEKDGKMRTLYDQKECKSARGVFWAGSEKLALREWCVLKKAARLELFFISSCRWTKCDMFFLELLPFSVRHIHFRKVGRGGGHLQVLKKIYRPRVIFKVLGPPWLVQFRLTLGCLWKGPLQDFLFFLWITKTLSIRLRKRTTTNRHLYVSQYGVAWSAGVAKGSKENVPS